MKKQEQIDIVRKMIDDGVVTQEQAAKYFPELADSEDEKIRKALLEMVHDNTDDELWIDYDVHKEEALAYLEKWGEQKHEWSEEDEKMRIRFFACLGYHYNDGMITRKEYEEAHNWLKNLRPHPCWEPSKEMLEALYRAVPQNVKEMSEDEILLDKLYQALKYGIVVK